MKKTPVEFLEWSTYKGDVMAKLMTQEELIPINALIDNAEEYADAEPETQFEIQLGATCGHLKVFETAEEAGAASGLAPFAMIPCGTFPADPEDKNFVESPHIIFQGQVEGVMKLNPTDPEGPNYYIAVSTYGLDFEALIRFEGTIRVGWYLTGMAFLYGNLEPMSV